MLPGWIRNTIKQIIHTLPHGRSVGGAKLQIHHGLQRGDHPDQPHQSQNTSQAQHPQPTRPAPTAWGLQFTVYLRMENNCVYTYMYLCMHICIYIYIHTYILTCIAIIIHIFIYIYVIANCKCVYLCSISFTWWSFLHVIHFCHSWAQQFPSSPGTPRQSQAGAAACPSPFQRTGQGRIHR